MRASPRRYPLKSKSPALTHRALGWSAATRRIFVVRLQAAPFKPALYATLDSAKTSLSSGSRST